MALLFLDSFDHYSITQANSKWTVAPGGAFVAGRTGIALSTGAAQGLPAKTFGPEYATLTAGTAHNTTGFSNQILRFDQALYSCRADLAHIGDGRLRLIASISGSTAVSASSTFVMNANRWYYVEMQAALTGGPPTASMHVTARINEDEILSLDHSASASFPLKFATFSLGAPGGGLSALHDDVYVTEDEFLGDIRVGVLYPNAPGDSASWTPNGAGANWEKVKEHPPDSDVTYVSTPTLGALDLYNIDDIDPTFTGDIKGAQALWMAKKSDEGTGSIKGQWKSGATIIEGEEFFVSAASYLYSIQAERKSLFTAADWSHAEIDSLQLGVKRET